MKTNEFRRLARSLPESVESEHMGHPDFRVGGKIFATLGAPGPEWGMVKLTVDQQQHYVHVAPDVFMPVPGGWGRRGYTNVVLENATKENLWEALVTAWRNVAPKQIAAQLE